MRYDTSENAVQYTNDGGMTWNNLTSDTIEWRNNKAYAIGTVVLHGQAFYACVEEIEGPTYPEPGNTTAWRLLTIGSVCQIVKNAAQLKTAL